MTVIWLGLIRSVFYLMFFVNICGFVGLVSVSLVIMLMTS